MVGLLLFLNLKGGGEGVGIGIWEKSSFEKSCGF